MPAGKKWRFGLACTALIASVVMIFLPDPQILPAIACFVVFTRLVE